MASESQRVIAASLLASQSDWLWKWSADGEAVVWQDGSTVVMREELALIIHRLIPSGVPPIGPLMLLLAACRGKVPAESEVLDLCRLAVDPSAAPFAARAQLAALAKMPRELLAGVPAKASLAALVFDAAPKLDANEASAVVALLREGLPPSAWPVAPIKARLRSLIAEMRALHDGLAPLDSAKIEHALRTGIPEAPRAADVELPLGERVLALLRELETDSEFAGLARLARDVMAAVTLPRALPQPDHDSPGGFSDIGNRGQLHRLLLSELAHDDDTLAARIALGEALYLRREPAANSPPSTLALLVDSGLRMWGTPRVFGAAVAMACLAKTGLRHGTMAFRASGGQAEPLSLATRAGLTEHLAALDTAINPSAALGPLAAKLRTVDGQLDVIVVTHPLAMEDADFNAACASQGAASIHAATVDRDGAFALHLRTPGGWKPMAAARLKLDALFPAESRRAVPRESAPGPAMFRREQCVFLLPIPGKLRGTCPVRNANPPSGDTGAGSEFPTSGGGRSAGIAEDGSYWEWTDPLKRGAVRLKSVKLTGSLCALFFDRATSCVIAVGHETRGGRVNLIRKFLDGDERPIHVTELPSPMERPIRVWARGGHLFLGTGRQVHVVNIGTGTVVAQALLGQGMSWLNGRFAVRYEDHGRAFMVAAFDGTRVFFAALGQQWLRRNSAVVLQLIEREGSEALVVLDTKGRFLDAESGALQFDTHMGLLGEVHASRDGHRFWLRDTGQVCNRVDLATRRIIKSYPGDSDIDGARPPHPWALRSKFTHIATHSSGRVWLCAKRGYWVAITLNEGSHTFGFEQQPWGSEPSGAVAFGPPEEITGHGCCLSLAELGGGGRAWLDSRGMLHLQAADLFLPEITIVLAESKSLPAWSSDDTIVGPEYFLGDRQPRRGDAKKIDAHLRAFVASCK